jgi:hypothetical protein
MTKLVLITGKAQAGKSSLAESYRNHQYMISGSFNLADSLKSTCQTLFGISPELLWGNGIAKETLTHIRFADLPVYFPAEAEIDPERRLTVRELLQYFGTNIMRRMDPNVWCRATANAIERERASRGEDGIGCLSRVIIGDARFPNEIEYFSDPVNCAKHRFDPNPVVVRLTRNITHLTHVSETALDNYDFSRLANYIEIDNTHMGEDEKNDLCIRLINEKLGATT